MSSNFPPKAQEVTLCAGTSIFEYIKLPKDKFVTQTLPWKIPDRKESIENYAKRMCEEIEHKNCILIAFTNIVKFTRNKT